VHTVFAMNQNDDTLSAISTQTCRGGMTSGCPKLAPAQQAAPNQGPEYNPFPSFFVLIPQLSSLYLVNVGGASILSVVNPSRCDATHDSACRQPAPTAPESEYLTSIDPATNTIYAGNLSLPQIDVIDGATCHGSDPSGCAQGFPAIGVGRSPELVAVDTRTDTIYVTDFASAAISVINGSACQAAATSGCREPAPLQAAGSQPLGISLNPQTGNLYVTQLFQAGSMSIFSTRQ